MQNSIYNSEIYISPKWTDSATISMTLTSASVGGLAVAQVEISNTPSFASYSIIAITTSPQTVVYTLTNPSVDGLKYVYIRYRNSIGNVSPIYSSSIYLDTSNPSQPGQLLSNSSWSTTDSEGNPQIVWSWTASYDANTVTSYTIQVYEDTGSGYVLKHEAGSTTTSYTYKNLVDDALYRIRVRAIDLVGKQSAWSEYSTAVTADTQPPQNAVVTVVNSTHSSITETDTKNIELKVEAEEDVTESGLKRVRFRNKPLKTSFRGTTIEYEIGNWSAWFTFTTSPSYYDWALPTNSYGDIKVEAQIQDVAQNSVYVTDTVTVLRGFIIDTVAPSGTMEINDGDPSSANTTVKLEMTGSDATTDVYAIRFRDSDRVWSDWEPFDLVRYYSMEATEGLKVVEAQFKDYGGNISTNVEQLFNKDFVEPSTDTTSTYLTNQKINKFVIHNDHLYAFSNDSRVGTGETVVYYAKVYQFINNQFIKIYEFEDEEEYEISAVESFGGNIYIGTSQILAAKVYLFNTNDSTMTLSSNFSNLEDRINSLEVYNSQLYAASGSGYVYSFDGSAWSSIGDSSTIDTGEATVVDLQVYNNYLHIATGNSGNMYSFDGTDLSAAMSTGALVIENLTIINDMLVGIDKSQKKIYIYREVLDNSIWSERVLFNREPSDTKNTVIWDKFISGDASTIIDLGVMEIDTPTGSTLLYIQDELGHTWYDGVSNGVGWTIQATVIYDSTTVGEQGIRFSDGTYTGALHFDSSGVTLSYGDESEEYTVDMSTPREIRIVGKGTALKVFVDRIQAISVTDWGASSSSKTLQFGDVSLYDSSNAKWDALKISITGAYEPTDTASRSDITVIPWTSISIPVTDMAAVEVLRNATDIEDEITTVLVNDTSISEISSEIDDAVTSITAVNNFIGSVAYEDIFTEAVTEERLNETTSHDVTTIQGKFSSSKNTFANLSSMLTTAKSSIASMDEINIQTFLTELDAIAVNVSFYAIEIESIIEDSIPELPTPRSAEAVTALEDGIDEINTELDSYIIDLNVIIENLSEAGDEVYVSGINNTGVAEVWSTFDFSTYSSVTTLTDSVDATTAMELFPCDDIGGEIENRIFIAGEVSALPSKGYIKLIRDSYIADDIMLDTTPPDGVIIISPDGSGDGATQTNSNIVTLKLTGEDVLSGVYEYALSANNDFSGVTYSKWSSSPTWINNYNLTSTETAFVEIEDFTSDIISSVVFDNMLYVGTYSGKIYRTSDFSSFTLVFDGSSPINALAAYDLKIYAGTQSGVLLESSNGALNQWVTKTTGLVNSSGGSDAVPIYCMTVINSVLYIGGGNSLLNYFSMDTLNYVYNFSETAVLSIVSFVKSSSTYIMVGTSSAGKIFILNPTTNVWSVSLNTPETEISAMSAANLDDLDDDPQYILAGTYPRGRLYLYTISSDAWELYHDTAETKIYSMANMELGSGSTTYPAIVIGTGNNGNSFVLRKTTSSTSNSEIIDPEEDSTSSTSAPRIFALGGNLSADIIYTLCPFGDSMYFGTGDEGKLFKYNGSLVGNGVRSVYLSLKDRAGNVNITEISDEIDLELFYENMLIEVDSGGEAQFIYTAGDSRLFSGYKIEKEYAIYESVDFHGGEDFNQWNSLSWTETKPTGTSVEIYIKSAETKTGLLTADYEGPYTTFSGNDISELDGSWIKFKIVLETETASVTPYVHSLIISYYAAESVHFFTSLFNLSGDIEAGIATWTATVPEFADIKVGLATEDTVDWNDYQILTNNKAFSVVSPDNKFKIGIRFIASGAEAPSLDEFAIAWSNTNDSTDLVNQ